MTVSVSEISPFCKYQADAREISHINAGTAVSKDGYLFK
jgi:hypothetical protein